MRKARIFLGVTGVAAMVAAAFAINVNGSSKALTTIYTHAPNDPLTKCTVARPGVTTTDEGAVQVLATFNSAQACVLTFTKITD